MTARSKRSGTETKGHRSAAGLTPERENRNFPYTLSLPKREKGEERKRMHHSWNRRNDEPQNRAVKPAPTAVNTTSSTREKKGSSFIPRRWGRKKVSPRKREKKMLKTITVPRERKKSQVRAGEHLRCEKRKLFWLDQGKGSDEGGKKTGDLHRGKKN